MGIVHAHSFMTGLIYNGNICMYGVCQLYKSQYFWCVFFFSEKAHADILNKMYAAVINEAPGTQHIQNVKLKVMTNNVQQKCPVFANLLFPRVTDELCLNCLFLQMQRTVDAFSTRHPQSFDGEKILG